MRRASAGGARRTRSEVAMTAGKSTERKEIGDVAMGLGADAGSAGIVRTRSR